MTKSKYRGYISVRAHRRALAKAVRPLETRLRELRTENHALSERNVACERRITDLAKVFVTAENYYRAQRLIADLIGGADAPIAAELRDQVLAALYYGRAPKGTRASSTDVETRGRDVLGELKDKWTA